MKTGRARTSNPRSAYLSTIAARPPLTAPSEPSKASVDKGKPHDEPREEAGEPERDRKSHERAEPVPRCRAGHHRASERGPRRSRVRPPRRSLGHRCLGSRNRDETIGTAPKEEIAAQARQMPVPGGEANISKTGRGRPGLL